MGLEAGHGVSLHRAGLLVCTPFSRVVSWPGLESSMPAPAQVLFSHRV